MSQMVPYVPRIVRERLLRGLREKGAGMPGYNSSFDLSIEDMELIETALRRSKAELSARAIAPEAIANADEAPEATLRKIHDLLGRLHNQKVFYRPRRGCYIGG
tara:strand:- start:2518 stop:2829 length:312 start_codon:yes stop_codon:yes gene_type:complete